MQQTLLIQMSKQDLEQILERAIERALTIDAQYRDKFNELPERINQTQAANFLGVHLTTIGEWRKNNKLRFEHPSGKRPFIRKRIFIEDCKKHQLV